MAEKKTEKWKSARTKNLSESQMKRAQRVVGGGRMEKVTATERKAAGKGVDIGTTKWMTSAERGGKGRGGLLTDQSGKAVTGTVKLPSGQSATYVRGKRIGVARGGASTSRGNDTSKEDTGRKRVGPMSSSSAEALRRARNQDRKTGAGAGSRGAMSGTVSSAIAKGQKQGASAPPSAPPSAPVSGASQSRARVGSPTQRKIAALRFQVSQARDRLRASQAAAQKNSQKREQAKRDERTLLDLQRQLNDLTRQGAK